MNRINTVKMKDVAEHAGVSSMTVSLVLRGAKTSERISPETRQRVLDAAKKLHYFPNARGRALRSGVTNIIGLYGGHVFVNVRKPFFTEIISGLQIGCEQFKKDLLVHGNFHGNTADDLFNELVDGRIDGLVVTMPPTDPLVERLADLHFPVVALADPLPNIPSILVDDIGGSRRLVEYLHGQGHRRCVYLNDRVLPLSAVRRRQAFLEGAQSVAMQVIERTLSDRFTWEDFLHAEILGSDRPERPTVVVCWNDETAYDLLAKCRQYQVRVPEDIAIVGFDGCDTPYNSIWPLTTIRAPWAEAARQAIAYLEAMLQGEQVPQETILPVEFVQGHTA